MGAVRVHHSHESKLCEDRRQFPLIKEPQCTCATTTATTTATTATTAATAATTTTRSVDEKLAHTASTEALTDVQDKVRCVAAVEHEKLVPRCARPVSVLPFEEEDGPRTLR
eukprot:TRINITY_DN3436_c1_g1_i2.p2 TRINITY_DN3436_c1_g1~~TRINITY_DN3436_c1_g1_i2.p2  ORF type:complete len:112 (+),score=32.92 TRINITY_DN3436_c1_g1_i2:99-434(+)